MSCIFIITPLVVGNWAAMAALIGATATHLGFRAVRASKESNEQAADSHGVELEMANSEVMADQMRRGESISLVKDRIKIIISLDPGGRLSAKVEGPESIPKTELEAEGQEFLNKVIQQYAYQQVITELNGKGFSIVKEQQDADGRIRIRVRKFE